MSKTIKIFIVDDHEIVIDGLKSILNPFLNPAQTTASALPFRIIGIANNTEGLLEKIGALRELDVLIIDYYMPPFNGLDIADAVKKAFPAIKVILFSMEESDVIINEAFSKNIDAYVTKSEGRQRLLSAIQKVDKGERVFPPLKTEYSGRKIKDEAGKSAAGPILSKREIEITCLITKGNTTQEIADALNIAFNTVEVHRNNIHRKLDIHKLTELIQYANKHGLCP